MRDRENDGKLESRIFVGGLSWDVTEKQLETSFDRFGKIIECQIMVGKDTGRPRGFGFITFTDRRGADDAIKHMHGRQLGDRVISVNKAEPKAGGEDVDHFHKGGGYSSRGKGGDRGGEDECFKCGRVGHWARECPSTGGDRGRFRDHLSIFSRLGEFDGHKDRYGDRELERDRYMDGPRDRDGGRYGYRGGDKYETRDHYPMERYPPPGEQHLVSDRYGMPEHHHHLENEYRGRERSYERDRYARDASDRYGGMGPLRDEGRGYRSRPGPYDRPSRSGGRPSSYERW
ncbi:Glycine-rich RNA-binding protein RZ1B [Cardamine amara subsp. amara]|uniref:Glycine-rich RNA-binding protein RZ1B n=1 Tax=Cardamine amara subsp. amara TaxID=228776 RepID=A0ABD1CA85_CARAN